jgi:hypothetical protein
VPRDRIELPTRGFSALFMVRGKTAYFQHVDYVRYFFGDFGNLGQNLTKFDLDGHNLGTVHTVLARAHGCISVGHIPRSKKNYGY